jgi:glycosyltransferase involved in cell wall biosynthesis
VVVPTYNNKPSDRYKYNLLSILQQQYSAYHVVVIDDASTDGSGQLIDQLVEERGGGKVKVIHNDQQRKALANIRMAAFEHCHSE